MIATSALFRKRLLAEWQMNLRAWRLMVDWTVAVYIIVPFAYLGISQYLAWWAAPPAWLSLVPLDLFAVLCGLFAWTGTIRVFIARADQLFLWSRKNWIKATRIRGLAYSFLKNLAHTLLFFLLLAPFLMGCYRLLPGELAALFLTTLLARMIMGLQKQFIRFLFSGIKRFLLSASTAMLLPALFIFASRHLLFKALFAGLLIFFLSAACSYLSHLRVNLRTDFFEELEQELSEKLKFAGLVFAASGIAVPKPSKRARPLLFKKSNHLFRKRTAVNGLVELCLKSFLRNKTHLLYYAQLVAILALMVIAVPYLKWLLWLGAALLLTGFVGHCWNTFISTDFAKMFKWRAEDKLAASQKSLFLMALPGFAFISFAAGLQAFSWGGAFPAAAVGAIAAWALSKAAAFYMLAKGS
ncbi:MAG TPA: ABC transporter permease [Bacillota bacterium]|jgi:ABC-2 type transport system permease protein|nr:ABC transporter permease [Bacillota bacterium]HOP69614.1 ABC transporter permease [Bacillota bacterium]HPT34691.1 ABC transporter permease [Bacillota bacterium]HPZ65255.1 ABC transporter permease [Bacillota bacterium]HQD06277.1 ABC transporter permease [Bacillota bacterium]